jgi:hydroxyethylthiazole kinase
VGAPPDLASRLARLRATRPLVHCLTNQVTAREVADAVRAAGALPIMANAVEELDEIVAASQAVLVNLGTPTQARVEIVARAAALASARALPVVLDPVGAGASAFRTRIALRLLSAARISVVRANAGEAAALLGGRDTMRGVESAVSTASEALAADLARSRATVAAVTGARDAVSDGRRLLVVDNGHPLLARVVGGGDIATAVVAAVVAVEADPLVAAVCGLAMVGVAAEIAGRRPAGPASFRIALLDALAGLAPADLERAARVREVSGAWT